MWRGATFLDEVLSARRLQSQRPRDTYYVGVAGAEVREDRRGRAAGTRRRAARRRRARWPAFLVEVDGLLAAAPGIDHRDALAPWRGRPGTLVPGRAVRAASRDPGSAASRSPLPGDVLGGLLVERRRWTSRGAAPSASLPLRSSRGPVGRPCSSRRRRRVAHAVDTRGCQHSPARDGRAWRDRARRRRGQRPSQMFVSLSDRAQAEGAAHVVDRERRAMSGWRTPHARERRGGRGRSRGCFGLRAVIPRNCLPR